MPNILELSNGSLSAPELIKGVVKFPGKGVALRNEFNKIIDFIKEPDDVRQDVIVKVLKRIVDNRRDWAQPNWADEFAKGLKAARARAQAATTDPAEEEAPVDAQDTGSLQTGPAGRSKKAN